MDSGLFNFNNTSFPETTAKSTNSSSMIGNNPHQPAQAPQGPYFVNPPPLAAPMPKLTAPNAGQPMPTIEQMMADTWFWHRQATEVLANGTMVSGTYKYLFDHHPDTRMSIFRWYCTLMRPDMQLEDEMPQQMQIGAQSAGREIPVQETMMPETMMPETMMPETMVPELTINGVVGVRDDGAVSKTLTAPGMTAGPFISTPAPKTPRAQLAHVDEGAMTPPLPPTPQSWVAKPAEAAPEPEEPPPEYVEDIADADDARWQLAHPDSTNYVKFTVPGDDLETVQGEMHKYAKRLYDALTHNGLEELTLPTGRRRNVALVERVKSAFVKQQEDGLMEVRLLLKKPQQAKDARARCAIAFEAAVFVHETGILKEVNDRLPAKNKSTKERYTRVNKTLTCSKRLGQMIKMVQQYKLVALDVLQGENLQKFANDPVAYVDNKVSYLISNVTRQTRAEAAAARKDAANAKKEAADAKQTGRKRKAANESEDEETDDDDGHVMPLRKRAR